VASKNIWKDGFHAVRSLKRAGSMGEVGEGLGLAVFADQAAIGDAVLGPEISP
jgi:hypothetical protein